MDDEQWDKIGKEANRALMQIVFTAILAGALLAGVSAFLVWLWT